MQRVTRPRSGSPVGVALRTPTGPDHRLQPVPGIVSPLSYSALAVQGSAATAKKVLA